jgi:integral membrane sensor domain MASE1
MSWYRSLPLGARCVGVAVLYALAAQPGMTLAIPPGNVTAVFPASGIGLAAAFRMSWWGVLGTGLGSFSMNALLTPTATGWKRLALSLVIGLGAMLQATVGAWTLGGPGASEPPLRRPRGVFRFAALAALAACLINATLSVSALRGLGLLEPERAAQVWFTWWLGDATGVLTAAPLLLVEPEPAVPERSTAEGALLLVAAVLVGVVVLWSAYPLFFLLLPLLIWGAFRFGQRGAAWVVALLSLLCVGAAVERAGFAGRISLAESLLLLQAFLGVAALSGLTLGALVEARARAEQALRQVNDALEARVEDQTREMQATNQRLKEQEQRLRTYNEALEARLRASVSERSEQLSESLAKLISSGPQASGPLPGHTFGRVRVGRRVGSGGMSEVFEAEEIATGQRVALKVLRDPLSHRNLPDIVREAMALAAVAHPTIIRMIHVDVAPEGSLYLLLEWVQGESLASRLKRTSTLALPMVLRLGALLAEGLATAHAGGVIHCDIKPANVMLTDDAPGVKILDFGISRMERRSGVSPAGSSLAGSPPYVSPEQISEPEQVGPPADVYSLGVLLFEALAGTRPFEAASASGFLLAHLTQAIPDLRAQSPTIPSHVAALVGRMLAKAPASRPSAAEVASALQAEAEAMGAPSLEALLAAARSAAVADTAALPVLPRRGTPETA